MIGLFVRYLTLAGGTAAGTQVTRGVVRGARRLVGGDARGALSEVGAVWGRLWSPRSIKSPSSAARSVTRQPG
jgi:hypothetical protein